jgi:hypothetical protein
MLSARDQSHNVAAKCDRLIALAQAMPAVSERRRAIALAWYEQLLELTQASSLETPDGERALDCDAQRETYERFASAGARMGHAVATCNKSR